MELVDVWRRVVVGHWRVVVVCVVVGVAAVAAFGPRSAGYSASARLVLDVPDPQTNSATAGVADTAQAIATSPSEVAAALRDAGVRGRDPVVEAKSVSASSLGQSAVVDVSVSDRDPRVAAALANALAARVIRTRLAVTRGQIAQVTASLDQRIGRVNQQVADAQVAIDRLTVQLAGTKDPVAANALRARQSGTVRELDLLDQTRSSLESQRISLLSSSAVQREPQVISPAVVPSVPVASGLKTYVVLAIFLGLVVGVGIAGVKETVRPRLVGSDAVARELDAPLLGTLSMEPGAASAVELGPLAMRLRLAGKAAGLPSVRVVPARDGTDLAEFAQWLDDSRRVSADSEAGVVGAALGVREAGGSGAVLADMPYRIRPFDAESMLMNGSRTGLVLVAPDRMARSELDTAMHLLRVMPGQLLGVVTYRQTRPRRAASRRAANRRTNGE
jgi:capsular polysaccharide biosynthesis protein